MLDKAKNLRETTRDIVKIDCRNIRDEANALEIREGFHLIFKHCKGTLTSGTREGESAALNALATVTQSQANDPPEDI